MALTCTINGTDRTDYLQRASTGNTFTVDWPVAGIARLTCAVADTDSTSAAFRPTIGQSIVLKDGSTTLFSGNITGLTDMPVIEPKTGTLVRIDAQDLTAVLDRLKINRTFTTGNTLKQVLQSILSTELTGQGITLHASQTNGPTLTELTFDNVTLREAFNRLMVIASGYVWRITPDGKLRFFTIGTETAGYSLTATNKKDIGGPKWSKVRTPGKYANRIRLQYGPAAQLDKTDSFTTTTGQTSWDLTYPIATATGRGYITVNGVFTPVGRFGVDSTTWTIDKSGQKIRRTSAPTAGTTIAITYPVQFPLSVTVNDTALQSTDGIWAKDYTNESITDKGQAEDYADGLLARDKTTPTIVEIATREGIVYPGDTITLTYTDRVVSGSYLVVNVNVADLGAADEKPIYRLKCASGSQTPATWQEFWGSLGSGGASSSGSAGSVSGGLIPNLSGSFNEDVTAQADSAKPVIIGNPSDLWDGPGINIGNQWWILAIPNGSTPDELRFFDAQYSQTDDVFRVWCDATNYYIRPNDVTNTLRPIFLGENASGKRWAEVIGEKVRAQQGYYERARTTPLGEWIDVAHNAGDFTANGSMTWTVQSGDLACFSYTLIGKTMTLTVIVNTSSVGGTLNNSLRVAIPGGFTVASGFRATTGCRVIQGATNEIGFITAGSGSTFVEIGRPGAVNFVSSTDTTAVQGTITFKVT